MGEYFCAGILIRTVTVTEEDRSGHEDCSFSIKTNDNLINRKLLFPVTDELLLEAMCHLLYSLLSQYCILTKRYCDDDELPLVVFESPSFPFR